MAGERVIGLLKQHRKCYQQTSKKGHSRMLCEFCKITEYPCKYLVEC